MPVEDVFQLLVGTVQVVSKQVLLIQEIQLKSLVWELKNYSTITGVEMFRKILDRGEAGDNRFIVAGFKRIIKRGMVIIKPGSVNHTQKLRFIS
jgi:translation elongation factor EF-Tu-like GTPase